MQAVHNHGFAQPSGWRPPLTSWTWPAWRSPWAQQRYGIIRILALLVLSLWLRGVSIIFNITRIYMNLIGKVATIPGPSLTNFDRGFTR